MSKVALMCGHGKSTDGTWDCGTAYGGNNEAALMLLITKAAVKYLRASGVTVISDADTNNNKNMIADVSWANKEKVSIYVSIHCDWYKAPTGTMPLYVSTKGKALATAINKAVMSGMGMKTRGVTKRTDLYELNYTDAPACIFETGSIKADIKKLKDSDKYGKCIAQGICNYLGVAFKESAPAPAPKPTPAPTTTTSKKLYRVRKTWADSKSQIGAYKILDNAKKACDQHKGYSVFDENGKVVYPVKTKEDKLLDACKAQADWMKNAKYGSYKPVTLAHSKTAGTCVTYEGCVFQRVGALASGEYIWQDGKGYGTGKVTHLNSKTMTCTYMGNKTLASLKSTIKKGDCILLDDNKSGVSGSGGHVFFCTGEWSGNDPYIWDFESSKTCAKTGKPRKYSGSRKVLAIVRLK